MIKKSKRNFIIIFSISLICSALHLYHDFFEGHIFAESIEESQTTDDLKDSSKDSSSKEVSHKQKSAIESEGKKTKQVTKIDTISEKEKLLEEGWESVTINDSISNNGYKIEWKNGTWFYTYQGESWIFSNANWHSIGAGLIVNGAFIDPMKDDFLGGFMFDNIDSSDFYINRELKALMRTYKYYDRYKIDIIQQLMDNNAVEITYQVTNLGSDTQKIGISQTVDIFLERDDVPVTPISNFKGLNLTSNENSLSILPDTKTMPNWAAGTYTSQSNFGIYYPNEFDGVGWETGKQVTYSSNGTLEQIELKENVPTDVSDSVVGMKNPGVNVRSNESTSFKQTLKYGLLMPPEITLNKASGAIYQSEALIIDGTISDKDNKNYNIYLEMDDEDKTLIEIGNYTDIPYGEVQTYQASIEGKLFSPGKHTVSIVGIDEYGMRSGGGKFELTINELSAEPKIQKVKIGETISNELSTLFNEVKGSNVILKNPLSLDSTVIGFQWIEATLVDENKKEIIEKIPVNVYNEKSTEFNDTDKIALDAQDTSFGLADVRKSAEEGTLDELVLQKVNPQAWNMEDGMEIPVTLVKNEIKPIMGDYNGAFKGIRPDSGGILEKDTNLSVMGELKFKKIPETLNYKTTKINPKMNYIERMEPNWEIEIENTIGSNWTLFASSIPFENLQNEKLKDILVLRQNQAQDIVINESNQKIMSGSESFTTIKWAETAGLLLKITPDTKIGTYQSEVLWLLSDAP